MIFYFSGTGNSLWVAQKIKSILNEDLISIPEAIKNGKYNYEAKPDEKIGFVFPVYFYGIPNIVNEFIDKLTINFDEKPYIYSVITCGADIASADRMFAKACKKRGYTLCGSFSIVMPDNSAILYKSPNIEKQKNHLAASEKAIEKIILEIESKKVRPYSSSISSRLKTAALYPAYNLIRRTKPFYADDKCIGCGFCEKICPCSAIEVRDGKKPRWVKDRCTYCLGCINRCPMKAIQCGKFTSKRTRYQNPVFNKKSS